MAIRRYRDHNREEANIANFIGADLFACLSRGMSPVRSTSIGRLGVRNWNLGGNQIRDLTIAATKVQEYFITFSRLYISFYQDFRRISYSILHSFFFFFKEYILVL